MVNGGRHHHAWPSVQCRHRVDDKQATQSERNYVRPYSISRRMTTNPFIIPQRTPPNNFVAVTTFAFIPVHPLYALSRGCIRCWHRASDRAPGVDGAPLVYPPIQSSDLRFTTRESKGGPCCSGIRGRSSCRTVRSLERRWASSGDEGTLWVHRKAALED